MTFKTSIATSVVCDLGPTTLLLRPGDTLTVVTRASSAQRGDNAVIFKDCAIP